MTWLSKFESIVKARTPGKWEAYDTDACWLVSSPIHAICSVTVSYSLPSTDKLNATFLALSGSIADDLLELVQAANFIASHPLFGPNEFEKMETPGSIWPQIKTMREALAKLAAKINEHK